MKNDEMKIILKEISARLDVIYRTEKHWSKEWKKGETGMILNPPALPSAIDGLERTIGKKLPLSFRQFLSITDGCDHFWEDFRFPGTAAKRLSRFTKEIDEYVRDQKKDVKEEFGKVTEETIDRMESESPRFLYLPRHIPIATTFGGALYVFDTRTKTSDGEMGVVYWDLGFGAWDDRRDSSFSALLERTLKEVDERAKKCKPSLAAKASAKKAPAKKASAKKAK